jgi:hypothetical protein
LWRKLNRFYVLHYEAMVFPHLQYLHPGVAVVSNPCCDKRMAVVSSLAAKSQPACRLFCVRCRCATLLFAVSRSFSCLCVSFVSQLRAPQPLISVSLVAFGWTSSALPIHRTLLHRIKTCPRVPELTPPTNSSVLESWMFM